MSELKLQGLEKTGGEDTNYKRKQKGLANNYKTTSLEKANQDGQHISQAYLCNYRMIDEAGLRV